MTSSGLEELVLAEVGRERERDRQRERECVCVCARACVCVCVRETERESSYIFSITALSNNMHLLYL